MNNSLTAHKVRAQLQRFLGVLSPRFSVPELKFLGDMLYGIQAAKDVKLSCIGRALDEDIPLRKTEMRLGRNLGREGFAGRVFDAIAREGARNIGKDTVIAVDPTDIRKLYARKMENLAAVRDGDKDEPGRGYWLCAAVSCQSGGRRITPLHLRLWSHEADGFVSENAEMFAAIDAVRAHAGRRGIYAIDRGGDRDEVFNHLADNKLGFVIRLVGNRNLVSRKREALAERLAGKCKMRYAETIRRETPEGEKVYAIEYGSMPVRLPHRDEELRIVAVRGFGDKPMMLLTTLASEGSRKSHWQAVEGYLTRWRVEDAIRFVKQSYRLEDIRLLAEEHDGGRAGDGALRRRLPRRGRAPQHPREQHHPRLQAALRCSGVPLLRHRRWHRHALPALRRVDAQAPARRHPRTPRAAPLFEFLKKNNSKNGGSPQNKHLTKAPLRL